MNDEMIIELGNFPDGRFKLIAVFDSSASNVRTSNGRITIVPKNGEVARLSKALELVNLFNDIDTNPALKRAVKVAREHHSILGNGQERTL